MATGLTGQERAASAAWEMTWSWARHASRVVLGIQAMSALRAQAPRESARSTPWGTEERAANQELARAPQARAAAEAVDAVNARAARPMLDPPEGGVGVVVAEGFLVEVAAPLDPRLHLRA